MYLLLTKNTQQQDSVSNVILILSFIISRIIIKKNKKNTFYLGVFRRAQIATDILRTRGDAVKFALRVKVFVFPENIKAIWVMLACKFKPGQ